MPVITSADNDFESKINSEQIVFVKFYADWCGSCRLLSPKFKRLAENEKYKNVLFLDVNAENNPEARKKAGVDSLPFFAAFKNGELAEGTATSKEDVMIQLLDKNI